ncbi:unnamed protein product [Durusdinium trenchii]|uniref:PDZ domain-containing protein n=1 Tax=Durusdinium trenchii TaxID=1381693 RepID=A0ABP0J103_9DINO
MAEFTVQLDLTGAPGLGLEVDWADGKTLLIKSVKATGAVPNWNSASDASKRIHANDRVLSINGTSGDPKAMLAVCKKDKKLSLLVRTGSSAPITSAVQTAVQTAADTGKAGTSAPVPKFFEFNVTVDMSFHTRLGLDVDWANSKSLYVRHLQAGAVEEWNRQHPAHLSVHAGDRIVSVNGFSENAEGMLSLCRELAQSRSSFQLRVRGPPPPPAESKDKDQEAPKEKESDSSEEKGKAKDKEKKKDKEKSKKDKEKEKAKDKEKSKKNKKDKEDKEKSRKRARSSSS